MAEPKTENSISLQTLDRLIAAHDGDVALLFLHELRLGHPDEEQAARDLCRTLDQIRAAEEKLRRMGLAEERPASPAPAASLPPEPAEELPQYTADEISRRSMGNEELEVLYAEAKPVLGHDLNSNEMRIIFGIYDHLGLPPEVILELLHFCREKSVGKDGEPRRVTAGTLEKEAYVWARREILTLDLAEDYIRSWKQRHSEIGRIREKLEMKSLSPTQEKDLNTWLEQGFGEEAIAIAADRTITNTGSLKWGYLRKILQSWNEKNLHSPAEIREKDPPRASRSLSPASQPRAQKPLSPDEWDSILKKI